MAEQHESGGPPLIRNFNKQTDQPPRETEAEQEQSTEFSATVSAELAAAEERYSALNRLDDRWKQISDRLASRMLTPPELAMEGGRLRSVMQDYEAYRREWDGHRNAIEIGAAEKTADIRAQGTTLSDLHDRAASPAPNAEPAHEPEPKSEPEPVPERPPSDRFQREFTVQAEGHDRAVER